MNLKESIETSETDCLVPAYPLVHHALYDQYVAKMTYRPVFRTPKADYLPTSAHALFPRITNKQAKTLHSL